MGKLSNGTIKRSEAERDALIEKFRRSGLSIGKFCEGKEIARSTFSGWLNNGRTKGKMSYTRQPEKKDNRFIEVSFDKKNDKSWDVEIELKCGTVFRLRG